MIVRPATFKDDHDRILSIVSQLPDLKRFRDRRTFSTDRAYASGWIRVAETDYGDIIGFSCSRSLDRFPQTTLCFIGVKERWQGKGVGRLLMNDIENVSNCEWSNSYIRLKVAPTNVAVANFFKNRGYEYEKDNLHMGKALW